MSRQLAAFFVAFWGAAAAQECLVNTISVGGPGFGSAVAAAADGLVVGDAAVDTSLAAGLVGSEALFVLQDDLALGGTIEDLAFDGERYAYVVNPPGGAATFARVVDAASGDTVWSIYYGPDEDMHIALTSNADGDWFALGLAASGFNVVEMYRRPPGAAPLAPYSFHSEVYPPLAQQSFTMRFGADVAMSGPTLAASAPQGDFNGTDAGEVYLYRWNGSSWAFVSFMAGNEPGDQAHSVVATDGATVIAGSPDADDYDDGVDIGVVSCWVWDGSIYDNAGTFVGTTPGERLGHAVAVDGDHAVAAREGSVDVLRKDGEMWEYRDTIEPPTPGADFGSALAVSASPLPRAFVGHPGATGGQGAVHVYAVGDPMTTSVFGTGLPGIAGTPYLLSASSCEFDGTLELVLGGMAPNSTAVLVIGFTSVASPLKGGVLWPSPDVVIAGLPTFGGALPITGTLPTDLGAFSLYMQSWIVDPTTPTGVSATNALRVDVPE